jgi:hypothetical protein
MARFTPAPIVGGAYKDDARSFSVQDTVNWIPERAEAEGTRSDGMLRDAPGAHVVCDLGNGAPVRGLHNAEGRLLVVCGGTLYEVSADFTATSRGSIPGVSRVSIAHNQITGGNEVLIANGQSGYVYNTLTETLAQVTDTAYPGAIVVDYLDQVMPQIEPLRRFWFHSDVTQATQYLSTDQYEAESAPDLLVTLIASHGQLLVFGERTGEFFQAVGDGSSFFERMEGTTMEVGCAAAHAAVRLDATVYWVGSDGIGYRLNGYSAERITTHAIEQAWARCDLKKCFAFTFEDRGHKIVYFTFPDGMTWGWDVATQLWHRRKSSGMNRWRMNALVYWNKQWIAGDYTNGKLYRLDWDHKLECCDPIERDRITGVLHDNLNPVGVNAVALVFEAGGEASIADGAPTISGDLPDGAVGDSVSYLYTITTQYPGQQYSLALTGALPAGLTLTHSGLVIGTRTAAGNSSWSITISTDCASTSITDSSVTAGGPPSRWWMTTNHPLESGSVWESTDLSGAWGDPVARDPNVATPDFGPASLGLDRVLIAGIESTLEMIQEFDATDGYTTTTVTLDAGIKFVRPVGSYAFAIDPDSSTYWVSPDKGDTWVSRTSFGTRKLQDIARLASGRWIGFVADGASSRFVYSDDANEPLTWHDSTIDPTATMHIASNGQVACGVSWSGGIRRTEDGLAWDLVSVSGITAIGTNTAGVAIGDVFLLTCAVATGGYLVRSADGGQTWATQDSSQIARLETDGATIVQSFAPPTSGATGARYSTDLGATWSDVAMPYTTSNADDIRVAPVRYT